jgi:hypothetical protein
MRDNTSRKSGIRVLAVAMILCYGLMTGFFLSGDSSRIYANSSSARNARSINKGLAQYRSKAHAKASKSKNVAKRKKVTSSIGTLAAGITDGNKSTNKWVGLPEGLQWIQIDLGQSYSINQVKLWHYFGDSRSYHDVIVRVSNDGNFVTGTTVFNNDTDNSAGFGIGTAGEYRETRAGKTITFTAVNARYVRIYSNGNTANSYNHYVETEIWSGGSGGSTVSNLPLTAGISVDNVQNTGNYTVKVTVPAGDTATVLRLYEGNSIVLSRTVITNAATVQTFTYPVSGKAAGSYVYRAESINAYGTTSSASLTVTVGNATPSPAVGKIMFDDFNYKSSADSALSAHGWWVRTGSGEPGPSGCTWSANNITFPTDSQNSSNMMMRLTATTNGSKTSQAEIETTSQKYYEGTYAARVRFTDAPASGPDGDQIVETFFTISPLDYDNDPKYSELDFEYLANGGWDVSGSAMWMTSWYTYTPEPWSQDSFSTTSRLSYNGWHTLVLVVTNSEMKYYLDGVLKATQTGKYYPRKKMTINFNLWFIAEGLLSNTASRSYIQDVDWVFHIKDTVVTTEQINTQVQSYRAQNITFTDQVN